MTNIAKHTPAPWRLSNEDGLPIVDANGNPLCYMEAYYPDGDSEVINRHNARLIAAAPELLEALKERVIAEEKEAHEAGEIDTPWLEKARAAIVKAEGWE